MLITTHCRSECEKSSQQWDARLRIIRHPVWCRSSWHDELQKDAQSFPAQRRLMTDAITYTQSHTTTVSCSQLPSTMQTDDWHNHLQSVTHYHSVMLTASQHNANWWLTQSPALSHTLPVSCSQLPSTMQTDDWRNHLQSVTHYHSVMLTASQRNADWWLTQSPAFSHIWQAVLTFFTISDINNSNCWYQQFELVISAIRIADINNSV